MYIVNSLDSEDSEILLRVSRPPSILCIAKQSGWASEAIQQNYFFSLSEK